MVVQTTISGHNFELKLQNVLLIPDFQLTLISINCLQSGGLTTFFLANTATCTVKHAHQTILSADYCSRLYHAYVSPIPAHMHFAHTSVNINLLHH
ncbi:hypothetical protein ID866_11810 [Astraeus odoratus]|nr:hypothetical protein ID866_11810 [Astraeus odoratus]